MTKERHERHAAEWEKLATEADQWATYEESKGRFGGTYRNKAELYRRAAKAIRLEGTTGAPHCACCLKPSAGAR